MDPQPQHHQQQEVAAVRVEDDEGGPPEAENPPQVEEGRNLDEVPPNRRPDLGHEDSDNYDDQEEESESDTDDEESDGSNEEESDNDNNMEEDAPVALLSCNRMALTDQERTWAYGIKEAIEGTPDLEPLSDFFYAQLAIIDQDNVEAAVERAQKLQAFRQEYKIVEQQHHVAISIVRHIINNVFPGLALSFTFNEYNGRYVLVADYTKMEKNRFHQHSASFLTAVYYMSHAINPDFAAIRQGAWLLAECQGFEPRNFGLEIYRQFWLEIASVYPLHYQRIKHFHTGLAFNLLASMARQFLPYSVHSKFQIGCISEFGRLDGVYLQPNLQQANDKFLRNFAICLQERYKHEQEFVL